jgi:sugar/nucleoside kinase (ribokinase family)
MTEVDFVAIGHVTLDETSEGVRPGGAAYYAGLTAWRLGLRVGVLTSHGDDVPADALPSNIAVVKAPTDRSTVYRVETSARGRQLVLRSRAADLDERYLPEEWRRAPIAMLCPVANEVDPALAVSFLDASLGVAPQGWLRGRGRNGTITPQPWTDADLVLPHAQSVVVSVEDIEPFEKEALGWFQQVPLGAVTRGRLGATLFVNGDPYPVEADPAAEVDAIGAGDVFAAALLIEYQREGNPWDAAAAAACAAAASVEVVGAAGIPDRAGLAARLRAYRRRQGA